MKSNLFKILLIALLFWGCGAQQALDTVNLAHIYQDEGVVLKPKFKVYQTSADSLNVYFEGSSDQLLYIKEPEESEFKASLGIRYRLYTDFQLTTLVDSGSITLDNLPKSPTLKLIQGMFSVALNPAQTYQKYVLQVVLTDLNRSLSYTDLVQIDVTDRQSAQTFLMTTPRGRVIYQNHYPLGLPFKLTHNSGSKTLSVRYYKRDFPIAAPPYAKNADQSFSYKADSVWQISNADSIHLSLPGFYHFQLDESSKAGFTVFSFYNEYPLITRKMNLGPPLRYLTTTEEYAKIDVDDYDKMKLEADKLWLRFAGGVERGKSMVSAYYSRVETANLYFTSYIEGWKTDRGIIYCILGAPTEVTRNEFQEYWVYGDPTSSLPYVFIFSRVKNPFSDNDYTLTRSNNFRFAWGQAIEGWRSGQIYGLKEIKRAQDERDRQQRATTPPYFWY